MIQNKTARNILYSWHGGQYSSFYAAASSGLVRDWGALLQDCECMRGDKYYPLDYAKLTEWLNHQRVKLGRTVIVKGETYYALPWVHGQYLKG